jgi:micrococcal nuclease
VKYLRLFAILILILISLISFYFYFFPKEPKTLVRVAEVIDGDTIMLANGKEIRLIGIDAPERGMPLYKKSRNKLRELIEGKEVILKEDVEKKDRYGRLLRYVFVDDIFVNLEMVRSGYANAYIVYPNTKYEEEFIKAEATAKRSKLGLWKYRLSSSISR